MRRLLWVASAQVLNISVDGDSTAPLGSLCQRLQPTGEKNQTRPPKEWDLWGKGEGNGPGHPWEDMTERGPHPCLPVSAGRDRSKDQALLHGPAMAQEEWAATDAQKTSPGHEEEFSCAVTEPWNRMPRQGVESPSLDIFQNCVHTTLCHVLEQEGGTKWPTVVPSNHAVSLWKAFLYLGLGRKYKDLCSTIWCCLSPVLSQQQHHMLWSHRDREAAAQHRCAHSQRLSQGWGSREHFKRFFSDLSISFCSPILYSIPIWSNLVDIVQDTKFPTVQSEFDPHGSGAKHSQRFSAILHSFQAAEIHYKRTRQSRTRAFVFLTSAKQG